MSTNWKAGDKAVCVDDSPSPDGLWIYPLGMPVKGHIYLVDRVDTMPAWTYSAGKPAIWVNGLLAVWPGLGEAPWTADCRFRKVVTRTEREAIEQEQEATR